MPGWGRGGSGSACCAVPHLIVDRLNNDLRAALASEAFEKQLVQAGDDPAPRTPEACAGNIKREEGKWAALIRKLVLTAE
jgi:tripartite-type tricarboxylate transporter receptor subunit TctC